LFARNNNIGKLGEGAGEAWDQTNVGSLCADRLKRKKAGRAMASGQDHTVRRRGGGGGASKGKA